MIFVEWGGQAVSVNRWHGMRQGRGGGTYISPTREYEEFVDDLASAILVATRPVRFYSLDYVHLAMQWSVGTAADDQNLMKPVCDAIERAMVVKNDRDIGVKIIVPGPRHRKGEQDRMLLGLTQDVAEVLREVAGGVFTGAEGVDA